MPRGNVKRLPLRNRRVSRIMAVDNLVTEICEQSAGAGVVAVKRTFEMPTAVAQGTLI